MKRVVAGVVVVAVVGGGLLIVRAALDDPAPSVPVTATDAAGELPGMDEGEAADPADTTPLSITTTTTDVADGRHPTAAPTTAPPPPARPAALGRLLFVRHGASGPPWHLFSVNPDGSDLRQLTHDGGNHDVLNWGASWSPEHDRIAFVRKDVGLMVMDADGRSERLLLPESRQQTSGAWTSWSPDGRFIAFAGRIDGAFVVDSSTGATTKLSDEQRYSPTWSPDGARIAFAAYRGPGVTDIVSVRPDGSSEVTIGPGASPSWGPDGRIAFTVAGGGGVAVMDADGRNAKVVVEDETADDPEWSRDGRSIAYARARGGVFIVDANGGSPHSLLSTAADDGQPAW